MPDARTRVTRLLTSNQTQYQPLQSAKVTIENDPNKRDNFEEAVNFLCKFAPKKSHSPGGLHRISAINSSDPKGDLDKLKDVEVEVRFYKPEEWRKLTPDQQKKCILTRRLQNNGGGKSGGKRKPLSFDQQSKRWRKKIEKQGRIIAALKAGKSDISNKDNNPNDSNSNDDEPKVTFNNSVTQRQGKKD